MSELDQTRSLADKAHREERVACDEMANSEKKAVENQTQLETLLCYRKECHDGLKTAKESGLSVVQVRECQLLIQYLDTVVETRQYKADISQEKYDESRVIWKKKREYYMQIKEKLELLEATEAVARQETLIDSTDDLSSKDYRTYQRKY